MAAQADDKKRRVLVVSQHYWPEQFRINDIVEGFLDHDIEVDVLCGLPNYPKGEWYEGYRYTGPRRQNHGGAEVFRCGEIRRKGNTSLRIFLNYCSYPFFALFSLPRLRGRKYDAVFCYESSPVMMIFPAIVYAKTHGVPLTTYVLDLWPDNLYSVLPIQNKLLRKIALGVSRWHYRRCDKLVALSEEQADLLRAMACTEKRHPQIAVIPQYSEDFYAEDRQDEALAARFAGFFNILFAGNISPAQDLENLVRAVKLVRAQQAGKDIQVLILGDGMSKEDLQATIKAEGMEDVFLFCGTVPATDIPLWTHFADGLFAGLSASENIGMTVPAKIASYLAAGRPLLCAMDGAGAKAAADSGAALVSPAGDAAALAQNILKLQAMDAAARQKMGQAGREYYRQHYKRNTLLQKLEDFIFA
ncbi:glycosyltransferase family 4 protein [Clostridia bacterium OttesenSCG-928-O13]|nr:glycosyltransferase family 4 protein [Clostridia bacterium OttesenSCG-928-O13]